MGKECVGFGSTNGPGRALGLDRGGAARREIPTNGRTDGRIPEVGSARERANGDDDGAEETAKKRTNGDDEEKH